MRRFPIAARLYIATVITVGIYLFTAGAVQATFARPALFLTLFVLSCATSAFNVTLPLAAGGSTMSLSYAIDVAALLLLGPAEATVIATIGGWMQCTVRAREANALHRTVFSMASLAITMQTAGLVYASTGGSTGALALPGDLAPLLAAATTFFLINTLTVATAIALTNQQPIGRVWHDNFLWSAPSYFVGAAAAAATVAVADSSGYWVVPLAVVPLYLTYRTYAVYMARIEQEQQQVRQMSDLHLATIEALARAIDAKDQLAQGHIRRVQVYAAGLARGIGMPEHEIAGVKTAALLHDIGKLAIPEHILSKPGPLTPEEFAKVREHPKTGADIIAAVPFPYPVAPLILCHHERWDGNGYPAGLRGEDIPLGARVLAVVDYFDALMAERPYHKAMSAEAALALLEQEAGRALDPRLVATFAELFPRLWAEASGDAAGLPPVAGLEGQQASGVLEPLKENVFADIVLAHREIYALYEIAQAMGTSLGLDDTMALIASKLSKLVPFSCCALFLYDEESDMLRCRTATGADQNVLQQIAVHNGDGVVGWVSRNRKPLLNARPAADLEAAGLTALSTSLQSTLVCPLIFDDRLIGTLAVYHTAAGFYTDDHRRLLDRVSEQAAAVINNSIVFEQTQADSLTDPLTGLPNTRFLFMHLTRELARAERLKSPLALLVMDLDDFKDINDSYGHHVGDRALCEVARVLRTGIRPYDICVRYAGDEFIVVLSGCGAEEAEQKRAELQRAIEEVFFEARSGRHVQLSVSVGAAVFPDDGEVYETLLATADSRMYQDKTRRKRRTDPRPRRPGDTAVASIGA